MKTRKAAKESEVAQMGKYDSKMQRIEIWVLGGVAVLVGLAYLISQVGS